MATLFPIGQAAASVSKPAPHVETPAEKTALDAAAVDKGIKPLAWHQCDGVFRCAKLPVPIDYSKPQLGSLDIAVIELPATSRHPEGDLVMNPGGPGGSGVDFLEQAWSSFPASIRAHFNLVSFDPRGVGLSDPVNCLTPSQLRQWIALNPDPETPSQIATVVAATKAFVRSCEEHNSMLLLRNIATIDEAKDMERLRAALGQPKLTYLGFSYGTYLGALYAEQFPTHVRAMVLDGAVDPALSAAVSDAQQAVGFEVDLHDFYNWCNTNTTCRRELPKGAKAAYATLLERLGKGAQIWARFTPPFGGSQRLTVGLAELGVISALYDESDWPYLAQGLQQALQGNGGDLALFAYEYAGLQPNGTYQNILSANVAISCVDSPGPSTLGAIEALARKLAKIAPDFGASEAWGGLPCVYWPVPPVGKPAPIHADGTPPILVVGSTNDPATPYSWAKALASQLQHGVLLTRNGPGHTGYLNSTCVQIWADRYLENLTLPPKGLVCPSS